MTPLGIGPRDVLSLARHAQHAEAAAAHRFSSRAILAPQLADALAAGGDRCARAGRAATRRRRARSCASSRAPRPPRTRRSSAPRPARSCPWSSCRPGSPRCGCRTSSRRTSSRSRRAAASPSRRSRTPSPARSAASGRRSPRGSPCCARRSSATGSSMRSSPRPRSRRSAAAGGHTFRCWRSSQARMLTDLAAAGGAPTPGDPRAAAEVVAPRLGAAVATGLLSRSLVRRLPVRDRLVEAAVAAGSTFALATLVARIGSVRSRS